MSESVPYSVTGSAHSLVTGNQLWSPGMALQSDCRGTCASLEVSLHSVGTRRLGVQAKLPLACTQWAQGSWTCRLSLPSPAGKWQPPSCQPLSGSQGLPFKPIGVATRQWQATSGDAISWHSFQKLLLPPSLI